MAVMMSVALPVWRHEAQRRKEDELIWRGNQYVRGIRLYQAKFAALPPSVDALVEGHFLRKKYKDPITNDDFELLGGGTSMPGVAPGQGQNLPGARGRSGQPTQGTTQLSTPAGGGTVAKTGMPTTSSTSNSPNSPGTSTSAAPVTNGMVPGGLTGVRSKSTAESIKIYMGRTHYNEWVFMFVGQQPGMGLPGRGTIGNPQRGQPGQNPPVGFPMPPGGGRGNRVGGPNGPGRGGSVPFEPPPGFPPNPGRRGGGL
jgi:hypothetical protein